VRPPYGGRTRRRDTRWLTATGTRGIYRAGTSPDGPRAQAQQVGVQKILDQGDLIRGWADLIESVVTRGLAACDQAGTLRTTPAGGVASRMTACRPTRHGDAGVGGEITPHPSQQHDRLVRRATRGQTNASPTRQYRESNMARRTSTSRSAGSPAACDGSTGCPADTHKPNCVFSQVPDWEGAIGPDGGRLPTTPGVPWIPARSTNEP